MVSGVVAYDKGAQKAHQKRRRKALTSIRRKLKLRRKSVKVERKARQCTETHAERTITRKGTHGNARVY